MIYIPFGCASGNIDPKPGMSHYTIKMLTTGSDLGGARPNVVLCKTSSALLCLLEKPSLMRGTQLGAIGLIGLRSACLTLS
jgi:hypothetical protein